MPIAQLRTDSENKYFASLPSDCSRKTLKMRCPGLSVPSSIEVDITSLDLNQNIKYTDITVPEGCRLVVKDHSLAILKIGGKMRRQ